ncbi:MAG: adenosylmethionine--8-amino-7-oxononanoate transaminase [bacterium]
MNSEDYRRLDRQTLWHPYSHYDQIQEEEFPVIRGGQGIYLYDVEGNEYLDAIASWWCCNLGHGQPRLVNRLKEQADKLQHSILGNQSHPPAVKLAERLVKLTGGQRRVHFGSDGASAVEAALKIALQYWFNRGEKGRTKFAYLAGDYHGDTLGAVSVGFVPGFHTPYRQALPEQLSAPAPDCVDCPYDETPESCDVPCFQPMAELLENNKEQLAGVIVEPLCQAAMGMNIYPPRYLQALAKKCNESDILLIDDEIAMGLGRTGTMWAYQQADIRPDIICVGKGLAGGYLPISAAVVDEEIYEEFETPPRDHTFMHGHTFAGNPLGAAVGLENLDIYREEDILQRVRKLAEVLREEFGDLEDLPEVQAVRTLGLLGVAYLDDTEGRGSERAETVKQKLLRKGIMLRPLGNVLYIMPPYIIEENQLKNVINEIKRTIEQEDF